MWTREQVITFIQEVRFGYLATRGKGRLLRIRPVGIKSVSGNELYLVTVNGTHKENEPIASRPAEVVWTQSGTNTQVRIRGQIVAADEAEAARRFREENPRIARMLPPGAEPFFRLYKLIPEKVETSLGRLPYAEAAW
ncbi:MAG TPA: pyridoxamine 5'-phosphate oxidase family protein [Anaerolineae bacterium]|nr:pyridoxamine 5'-phosphate oxidase family protein [Anaerolineae bacterium]